MENVRKEDKVMMKNVENECNEGQKGEKFQRIQWNSTQLYKI